MGASPCNPEVKFPAGMVKGTPQLRKLLNVAQPLALVLTEDEPTLLLQTPDYASSAYGVPCRRLQHSSPSQ